MMAELYRGTANVFIPGDIFKRLELLYNLSVTLLSRDGKLIIQTDADTRNIAVFKEAKSYLQNLFNLDTKKTHPLLLHDVWRIALENNLRAVLFFEQTFCITVLFEEGMFFSHGAESNARIFEEMVTNDPESALQIAIKANEFLNCVPFGHLIRTSPRLSERMKQCIAYSICKRNYQRKSYSAGHPDDRSARIHNDIDLTVVDVGEELPDLDNLAVVHRTSRELREIPADIFARFRYHFGVNLVIYAGQPRGMTFAALEATAHLTTGRAYLSKLLAGLTDLNYQTIPVVWQEAFLASPTLLSYLEKVLSVMLIFDAQTRALAVLGEAGARERLMTQLFTEREEDGGIEMAAALHVVFNREDISAEEVRRLPRPVVRRLAGFIERLGDPPAGDGAVIEVDSEDESVVEFMDLTIDERSSRQELLLRKIDLLTFAMKVKLTRKTEKAMCLGFSLVDVIKSILDKEPDRAALLSEEHFIGMLCDRQVSAMTPGATVTKNDANYTPLQKRFKRSFESEYLALRPLANSDDHNNPTTTKRHKLLIAVLKEHLGCPQEEEEEEEVEELRHKTPPIYPDLKQHGAGTSQARRPAAADNSVSTPTGVATKLVQQPPIQFQPPPPKVSQCPVRPSILSQRPLLRQNVPVSAGAFAAPQMVFPPPPPLPQGPVMPPPLPQGPVMPPPPHPDHDRHPKLRPVIIDGCNVAYSHGNNRFSAYGMVAAVEEFRRLGCSDIHVMLPRSRQGGPGAQHIADLERRGLLTFTPSRCLEDKSVGRRTFQTPYDDRLILRAAVDLDGVVVSNDNFRDIKNENRDFEDVVNNRTLMYCFVGDKFLVADDPFGPSGPSLFDVLRKKTNNYNFHPQFVI